MTLTDFLLARITEDEAVIADRPAYKTDNVMAWSRGLACALVSPARVQAECAAKRRIVEWAAPVLRNWPGAHPGARYISDDGLALLQILALPYASHPDYRQEWAA